MLLVFYVRSHYGLYIRRRAEASCTDNECWIISRSLTVSSIHPSLHPGRRASFICVYVMNSQAESRQQNERGRQIVARTTTNVRIAWETARRAVARWVKRRGRSTGSFLIVGNWEEKIASCYAIYLDGGMGAGAAAVRTWEHNGLSWRMRQTGHVHMFVFCFLPSRCVSRERKRENDL